MSDPSHDHDVLIIGAGAAGLAATRHLHAKGLNVLCLEAADRIGGRAHTDRALFGVPFDMGAHWLHTEQLNPFIEIGKSLGFDLYPQSETYLTHGDTDDVMWDEADAIGTAMEEAAQRPQDSAMLDVFRPVSPWSHTAAMMHALSMGRDMADISVKDWDLETEGRDWLCTQGFGAIVAAHAGDLPVRLSTPVTGITRTPAGVQVETAQGALTSRAVIVTVSVGVLRAGAIRFDPPLQNDRLSALEVITMGTYNHTALNFAPGTLPVKADTWVTYQIPPSEDQILRGGGFLCNVSGTGLTSFESSGTFGKELEEAGEEAAIDYALTTLTGIFGTDIRKGVLAGHATQWGRNPLTLGSYSGAMPGGSDLRVHLGQPHQEVIHFAGEATHLKEMATVAGAHKEGLRAADDVIRQLA